MDNAAFDAWKAHVAGSGHRGAQAPYVDDGPAATLGHGRGEGARQDERRLGVDVEGSVVHLLRSGLGRREASASGVVHQDVERAVDGIPYPLDQTAYRRGIAQVGDQIDRPATFGLDGSTSLGGPLSIATRDDDRVPVLSQAGRRRATDPTRRTGHQRP